MTIFTAGGGSDLLQKYSAKDSLRAGDFYVTRHSNLCDAHLVFHLVCDDTVMSNNVRQFLRFSREGLKYEP